MRVQEEFTINDIAKTFLVDASERGAKEIPPHTKCTAEHKNAFGALAENSGISLAEDETTNVPAKTIGRASKRQAFNK